MGWESFVGGGLTGSVIILGLSSWLGKVWAGRIMEKDRIKYETQMETLLQRLRTDDSKILYIHKLQFEKEFEIYKELWAHAIRLEQSVQCLAHLCFEPDQFFRDNDIENAQEYNIFEGFKKDLSEAAGKFTSIVRYNKPFYSQKIFEKANEILNMERTISDGIDYSIEGDQPEIKQMCQDISKSLNELCGLIRDCIWTNRGDN